MSISRHKIARVNSPLKSPEQRSQPERVRNVSSEISLGGDLNGKMKWFSRGMWGHKKTQVVFCSVNEFADKLKTKIVVTMTIDANVPVKSRGGNRSHFKWQLCQR